MLTDLGQRVHREASPPRTDEVWMQRVGGMSAMPALIRQLGADPIAVLASVDLEPDALNDADRRIPYATVGRLYGQAARQTGCAYFGLLAGRAWHLSSMGVVGQLVLHSATLGEALRRLTVSQHLNSQGGLAFLLERGPVIDVGYAIYHKNTESADQIYDSVLATGVNFIRELCGVGWNPSEVYLSRSRPADIEPYRRLFRAPLRFDSEITALRFPAEGMVHPVQGADPAKLRMAQEQAAGGGTTHLLDQVQRALRTLLLSGTVSGDEVAQLLMMHRRTFNRRLKDHGTTFQAILDQVRFEVARQLLAGTRASIDDIAAALGYASVSPFMRTFRRWAGTTPGQWRRAAGQG
jgi:AraC-like DNA-binding protein